MYQYLLITPFLLEKELQKYENKDYNPLVEGYF